MSSAQLTPSKGLSSVALSITSTQRDAARQSLTPKMAFDFEMSSVRVINTPTVEGQPCK